MDKGIKIVPNPAKEKLKVENLGDCSVTIYSISGTMVYTGKEAVIDVSGFTDGIYFISIADDDGIVVYHGKIFKE